jgi:pulcherriminic acid synthase
MLAKVEVETAVNLLLDAVDDLELTAPVHAEGVFTRAPTALPVRFRPAS